jgi:hypothetical protein
MQSLMKRYNLTDADIKGLETTQPINDIIDINDINDLGDRKQGDDEGNSGFPTF